MPDLSDFERLREMGDYGALRELLPAELDDWELFDARTILARTVAADVYAHEGSVDELERVIAPYNQAMERVPFAAVPRLLLTDALLRQGRNKSDEAMQILRKAGRIAAARDDRKLVAEIVHCKAEMLHSRGALAQAVNKFYGVIIAYAAQGRTYRVGLACLGMGRCLLRLGRVRRAGSVLETAVEVLTGSRDETNLALARESLARAVAARGWYERALRLHRSACETFDRRGSPDRSLASRASIVELLAWMGRYEEAQRAMAGIMPPERDARGESLRKMYQAQATADVLAGELDEAEEWASRAVELCKRSRSRIARAETRLSLAKVYLRQWRDVEATRELTAALRDAELGQDALLAMEIKAVLAGALDWLDPAKSGRLLSEVEEESRARRLVYIQQTCKRIREHKRKRAGPAYFGLSDSLGLNEARSRVAIWVLERALRKADGNVSGVARILKVSVDYARTLITRLRRGETKLYKGRPKKKGYLD